ncbi:MAG: hypothetical protein WA694_23735, partial [Pseudolabrys sp.]
IAVAATSASEGVLISGISNFSIAAVVLFRAPFGLPEGLPLFPGLKTISQWSVVSRLYFQ